MSGHNLIIEYKKLLKPLENTLFLEIGSDRDSGSTKKLANLAKENKMRFITVDPDENAYKRSISILSNIDKNFKAIKSLGEKYTKNIKQDVGAVYLDAFDIITDWPHKQSTIDSYKKRGVDFTNENAWTMHLEASKNLIEKIVLDGIICFDDTFMNSDGIWDGKGKLAVPFLLQNGFSKILKNEGAVVLRRNK